MIYFLEHEPIEGPGMLKPLFENNGFAITIIKLYEDQVLPNNFDLIEAIISLGGPMNVHEEEKYYFLSQEDVFTI